MKEIQYLSSRVVAGDTIYALGQKYDNVWALTPDVGGNLQTFKKNIPERFVDVGIAEQNLMGIAAGLALEGNIPFILGMIPFFAMRACEQVRSAICYQNLPVRIIGTGAGLTTGGGATHNATDDVSIMKTFVNMSVVSISDPQMIGAILTESISYPGPLFVRVGQGKKDPVMYDMDKVRFTIGKGLVARAGGDVAVIAHGDMVGKAMEAAEILGTDGISVRVVDMYSIKPLDVHLIRKAVREVGKIVVVEDHLAYGGLASSVADVFADSGEYPKAFKRLGVPQVYAGFGGADELRHKYGYDTEAIVSAVREMA